MKWRLLAAWALGLMVGAAGMAPVAGWRVERLRLDRDVAVNRLAALEKEVRALQTTIDRKQWNACQIRSVEIHINHDDMAVSLAAERELQPDLSRYIGRPLRQVDQYDLLRRFDRRLIKLEGNSYLTKLVQAFVGEKLALYLELNRLDASPPPG